MSALLCSSTSALLTDPLRRTFRPWRRLRAGRSGQRMMWSWARIIGGSPSPSVDPHAPSAPAGRADDRPVLAVLAPGRPPEPVVAEAAALAAQRSSPLVLVVLRRSIGLSTDAALVAATERAATTAQRELIARAAAALPHPALNRDDHPSPSGDRNRDGAAASSGAQLGINVDVVRVTTSDFDAPSPWVSRRVLSAARRWNAGIIVLPAVLLGPDLPPRSVTVVPIEDIQLNKGRGSGPVTGPGRRLRVHPRPVPTSVSDPAPGPDQAAPDGPRHPV